MILSVIPVFKNDREMSMEKYYHLVYLLSVVSKIFEKLKNNRLVNHLKKCNLFSDFQYDFTDLLDQLQIRVFNQCGATRDFALDILKSFDRVWYTGILYKPRFYGQMEYLFLFHLLLINVRLPAVLNGRSLQDNVICLPDNVICNIAVYADDTTLYTKGE